MCVRAHHSMADFPPDWLFGIPTPCAAACWSMPYAQCVGINLRGVDASGQPVASRCSRWVRDRCDMCSRPVCRLHGRSHYPGREVPPRHSEPCMQHACMLRAVLGGVVMCLCVCVFVVTGARPSLSGNRSSFTGGPVLLRLYPLPADRDPEDGPMASARAAQPQSESESLRCANARVTSPLVSPWH